MCACPQGIAGFLGSVSRSSDLDVRCKETHRATERWSDRQRQCWCWLSVDSSPGAREPGVYEDSIQRVKDGRLTEHREVAEKDSSFIA